MKLSRSKIWTAFGLTLIGLAIVLWLLLPVIPFLPISMGQRAAVGSGVLIVAEILWWIGFVAAGPEVARRIRRWLPTGWLRRLWSSARSRRLPRD